MVFLNIDKHLKFYLIITQNSGALQDDCVSFVGDLTVTRKCLMGTLLWQYFFRDSFLLSVLNGPLSTFFTMAIQVLYLGWAMALHTHTTPR